MNYRSRWTWLIAFLVLMLFCYLFVGTISAGMGLFGFVVGYTFSQMPTTPVE